MTKASVNCVGAAIAATLLTGATSVAANTKSCEQEMPEIATLIAGIPSGADKNTATHQFEKAKEHLAAGNERRCLLYLESARAAVEAEMMHDN